MTKYKKIYVFIIMFLVCSLSIGFSAFESNVVVGDIAATVRVQENIRITEFNYYSATSSATASSNDYAEELLISNINLPNADSTITYEVTVTNYGNTEMGVYELSGLPSNLTYEVNGYKIQDKICDAAANCTLGASKTFYLIIKYKENGYNSSNTNYSLNIGVEFRGFHAVTYVALTDNGFPAYVMDGGTLSINIIDELEVISAPTVYVNDRVIDSSEYSYVDSVLTYRNVKGTVKVSAVYLTGIVKNNSFPYSYSLGEFHVPNMLYVSANYSNGGTSYIGNYTVEPNRPLTEEDTELIVSYTENGITKTMTSEISVKNHSLKIFKNANSGGTCAVEVNGKQYAGQTTISVAPGSTIKFISDAAYVNNVVAEKEFVVNSSMSIVLGYSATTNGTTEIYAYTAWDFVSIPPIAQSINKSFDPTNGAMIAQNVMQITHIYDDGTAELITDYSVLPTTLPSTIGPSTVNISYQREGKTYSTDLPIYVNSSNGCFIEGTLVTMANGKKKSIEDVTYDDELLAWDFNTGRYAVTKPSLIETDSARKHRVLNLEFDDGTVIGVIDHHGFFDKKENDFVFIDETNVLSYIGHEFIKMSDNGAYKSVKLKSFSIEEKVTRFYTIQTAVYNNCIAEDMFTLTPPPDGYVGWFNYFEIGKNMKYDEFKKHNDIAKYGLYSYEEFSEYVTYEEFMAFNGPYLKVLVGKGLLTKEQILNAVSYYLK